MASLIRCFSILLVLAVLCPLAACQTTVRAVDSTSFDTGDRSGERIGGVRVFRPTDR